MTLFHQHGIVYGCIHSGPSLIATFGLGFGVEPKHAKTRQLKIKQHRMLWCEHRLNLPWYLPSANGELRPGACAADRDRTGVGRWVLRLARRLHDACEIQHRALQPAQKASHSLSKILSCYQGYQSQQDKGNGSHCGLHDEK